MDVYIWVITYLVVINLIGFVVMGNDKRRARKRAWRIPEATLFLVAAIGGAIGSIVGMQVFHHKTRHWYFVWGMPAILLIHIVIAYFIIKGPIQVITL